MRYISLVKNRKFVHLKIFLALIGVVVLATFLFIEYMPQRTETIYINGRFYTMDKRNTIAEAMAVNGDRIAGVGTREYIERKFNALNVIDLGGKIVLPGLIDAHCHLLGLGLQKLTVDLLGARSEEEATDRVRERLQKSQPRQWIRGRGWDQNEWVKKTFPIMNH